MSTPGNKKLLPALLVLIAVALLALGVYVSRPSTDPTLPTATPPATETQDVLQKAADETAQKQTATPQAPQKFTPTVQPEGRFIGAKDAPVQMIEFASLSCNHCAHFHNNVLDEFRVKYVDTGKVRIEFRTFPLNQPALDGAKLLNCLPESQYVPFMTMLYQTQSHWAFRNDHKDILKQNAKLAGLSDDEITACLDDKTKEEAFIQEVVKDIQKYQLQSTPTFILNGGVAKVVGVGSVADLAKEIDPLIDGTAVPRETTPLAPTGTEGTPAP